MAEQKRLRRQSVQSSCHGFQAASAVFANVVHKRVMFLLATSEWTLIFTPFKTTDSSEKQKKTQTNVNADERSTFSRKLTDAFTLMRPPCALPARYAALRHWPTCTYRFVMSRSATRQPSHPAPVSWPTMFSRPAPPRPCYVIGTMATPLFRSSYCRERVPRRPLRLPTSPCLRTNSAPRLPRHQDKPTPRTHTR